MDEEQVQVIRESNRNQLFLHRRKQKDEETDVRRSLANIRLNPLDVSTIANKLKTKVSISAAELKSLQNTLADEPNNIEVVLNTHGALRGLVRELTGHDVSKQIASCGCLCNLALGDSKTGCTIARAAGAYLVASLDSFTTQLAVACAWTLGNIAGSGARACDVIAAQGAVTKLCDVTRAGNVQEAAIYALTHVAYVMKDDLTAEHLQKMVESVSQVQLAVDSGRLLFALSCHRVFSPAQVPRARLAALPDDLCVSMERHLRLCYNADSKHKRETCCHLVYLVSVLANMNNCDIYNELMEYFVRNESVVRNIRRMVENDDRSMLWLLGNMLNCCGDGGFFQRLICCD